MKLDIIRRHAAVSLVAALVAISGPALAVDNETAIGTVDLTSVREKIDAGNFPAAVAELRGLAEDNQQADIYNLLGYSLRKTGDYATSLTYYERALTLQPDYKPAREYLGELYLETGNVAKAKEQLAILANLCPGGCEERVDLENAFAARAAN